jgi:hypothetical protein
MFIVTGPETATRFAGLPQEKSHISFHYTGGCLGLFREKKLTTETGTG